MHGDFLHFFFVLLGVSLLLFSLGRTRNTRIEYLCSPWEIRWTVQYGATNRRPFSFCGLCDIIIRETDSLVNYSAASRLCMYSRETNLDKNILLVHRLDYIPCSFFVVVNHCLLDELYIMALAMEYRRIKKEWSWASVADVLTWHFPCWFIISLFQTNVKYDDVTGVTPSVRFPGKTMSR